MSIIYLDHAATTPLDPRVLEAMSPYLQFEYGNPSSFHTLGKQAKDALEQARRSVARVFGSRPEEIIFTSGGTEANNLAILGAARAHLASGRHLITTTVEHHSVLGSFEHLAKKEGFEVTKIGVDKYGRVSVSEIMAALRPDTMLVSVMFANNEIGTIQPIAKIGNQLRKYREEPARKNNSRSAPYPLFHSDACQAAGALELNVQKNHLDLLTINAAKIYGPKGSGALFVRSGVKLEPLIHGGFQERGLRPGTENVAAIIGLARALEISEESRQTESKRLIELRDQLINGIKAKIPKTRLNGHPRERLPNNVNISILDVEGEAMILYLDAAGIEASTGSACTSLALDPSHVILATGLPYEAAHGSLRFTLGRATTTVNIERVLEILPPLVEKLRALSPLKLSERYLEV